MAQLPEDQLNVLLREGVDHMFERAAKTERVRYDFSKIESKRPVFIKETLRHKIRRKIRLSIENIKYYIASKIISWFESWY